MAKKRKKRSSPSAAPRRRKSTRRKGSRRRRSLSAGMIPFIGPMSLSNPLIGGAAGGFLASAIKEEFSDTIFGKPAANTDPNSFLVKVQPFAKGIVLAGMGFLARRYKYPEVAAGIVGYAAGLTRDKMQENGIFFKDNGGSGMLSEWIGRRELLSDEWLLSDERLLSHSYAGY